MNAYIPFFQPIVSVPSGRIVGYEALARQRLTDGSVVSAGALFSDPSVDKNYLLALDRYIREEAITAISRMPNNTFLTLNISPEWIDSQDSDDLFIPTIDMAQKLGIDPSRIVIEITESKGDILAIKRFVKRYREVGMRIAIDDFGAGYSELNRVVAIEPDLIKLDMRFFKSAIDGGIANEAVRAITYMAERTGCEVLCEGVETEQEFHFAIDCGATLIQGFLYHPACENFIPTKETIPKTTLYRQKFLALKIQQESEHIISYKKNLQHVRDIQLFLNNRYTEKNTQINVSLLPQASSNFIRFYICRSDGEQLTANYEYTGGQWHIDDSYIGLNWSGRPYLYQVIAVGSSLTKSEICSRPYRDHASKNLCQTIGVILDEQCILFADYIYFP
jgi:EAL domain-containing protein (putative c-di-GMP-specific phosphodiesterase class I)